MSKIHEYDVVVIGAGSGLSAAYWAIAAGQTVAVIEAREAELGGTCVNRGCIPTKGLIEVADRAIAVQEATHFGIAAPSPVQVDFGAVMQTVRERRLADDANTKGWVDKDMFPFYERARFVGDRLLELADGRQVRGRTVFIATGSCPSIPPIPGLEELRPWTSDDVLECTERPDSLIVLGAGAVGTELAHFFASVGTEVTLVDREGCLTDEDRDVRSVVVEALGQRMQLALHHDVVRAEPAGSSTRLVLRARDDGRPLKATADRVLVATGREPATESLQLDRTGVTVDQDGFIEVDDFLATRNGNVYAYGDVIGGTMFKHTASREGRLAFENSRGARVPMSYRANPPAVFIAPRVASVGLTEDACASSGIAHATIQKAYDSTARGRIAQASSGFAKLVYDPSTEEILGFHIVGPHAEELIHEVVVAMNVGDGTCGAIRDTIHIHPTFSELVASVFDAV